MHRAANENKTGKQNLGAFLAPSSAAPRGALGGSAGGGGLGAGCPDLSGSPTRLLQLPCLFKAGCRKGSRTAFIMQITRVNGQIPRWALEWNAELLAAGRGVRGGGALFAGLCSNLTAMAAKGDTRDLLSSLALPVACQGHRQGERKGEGRWVTPRWSRGEAPAPRAAALPRRNDALTAGHLPAPQGILEKQQGGAWARALEGEAFNPLSPKAPGSAGFIPALRDLRAGCSPNSPGSTCSPAGTEQEPPPRGDKTRQGQRSLPARSLRSAGRGLGPVQSRSEPEHSTTEEMGPAFRDHPDNAPAGAVTPQWAYRFTGVGTVYWIATFGQTPEETDGPRPFCAMLPSVKWE